MTPTPNRLKLESDVVVFELVISKHPAVETTGLPHISIITLFILHPGTR